MSAVYRVIIVDDHEHARSGIRQILQMDASFDIAAEAATGEEAIELVASHMPDLVLMDIRLPGMDGLEATKRIKNRYPAVKIVMVTVSDEPADLFEAIKKGAQGYLIKSISPKSWHEYLHAVVTDEAPMSRDFALRILREFSPKEKKVKPVASLTARETEILELVAQGKSNRDIAIALTISEHTVKNHLKNILQKLHLQNRVELTRYAYEKGWIQ